MENKQEKETFHYTYSAKEQQEIQNIRKKYIPPKEDRMELLRRMDESVTRKAAMAALIPGIVGTLFLGLGMSLAMSEFGRILGVDQKLGMVLEIVIGVAGIVLISLAYPVYNRVLKKEREKIAPEILRLTEELLR